MKVGVSYQRGTLVISHPVTLSTSPPESKTVTVPKECHPPSRVPVRQPLYHATSPPDLMTATVEREKDREREREEEREQRERPRRSATLRESAARLRTAAPLERNVAARARQKPAQPCAGAGRALAWAQAKATSWRARGRVLLCKQAVEEEAILPAVRGKKCQRDRVDSTAPPESRVTLP